MEDRIKRFRSSRINRARALRREHTAAEALLWRKLRAREAGWKFRRQHPFGPFVLDLYCVEAQLAVEVDGSQHMEPASLAYDRRRTAYLKSSGVVVLRFDNRQVLTELDGVLEVIWRELKRRTPSP